MKTKKIISLIVLLIIVSSAFFAIHQVKAATVGDIEKLKQTIPQLRVKIPGLEDPKEPSTVNVGDKTYIVIPWIANYIGAIYKYALGLASVLAVVVVMVGGILYLTSAGAPQRIEQGKNLIIGAISGLVIIIFSYVFLNLINPELIKLRPIAMETIKQELIAVDVPCSQLPAADVDVIVDGVPTLPSNAASFHCGQKYPVRAKANSKYTVAEGQFCDGAHCQGNKSCVDKKCLTGLIHVELAGFTFGFPRYLDKFQIYGLNADNEIIKVSEPYESEVRIRNKFVIPDDPFILKNLAKVTKIFFFIEINDTEAYPAFAAWTAKKKGKDINVAGLGGVITQALQGKLKPTDDDLYFVVKHYSKANTGIWGFPAPIVNNMSIADASCLETGQQCTILEPDDWGRFGPRKPWCRFWSPEELAEASGTGEPIQLIIDVDQFPEDPHNPSTGAPPELLWGPMQRLNDEEKAKLLIDHIAATDLDKYPINNCGYEYGCFSSLNDALIGVFHSTPYAPCQQLTDNTPPLPGTPCTQDGATKIIPDNDPMAPEELHNTTLTCVCIDFLGFQMGCEWVRGAPTNKSQQGELCVNYGKVESGEPVQECAAPLQCHYQCGGTPEVCGGENPILKCAGHCQEEQMPPVNGVGGSACLCGYYCPNTQGGEEMFCNSISNTCIYGEWGDHCEDKDDCDSTEGFECLDYLVDGSPLKFCGKTSGLERFQACTDTNQCVSGLKCRFLYYAHYPETDVAANKPHRCAEYQESDDDVDDNVGKVCIDDNYMKYTHGVCWCETNDQCEMSSVTTGTSPVKYWPDTDVDIDAGYCTKLADEYCSPVVEGGWCKPASPNPLPSAYQNEYNCQGVDGGNGNIGVIYKKKN